VWCGQSPATPPLDEQVKALAALHYKQGALFHWSPAEFRFLLDNILQEGDVITGLITGVIHYGTVSIRRAGIVIDTNRRILLDGVKSNKGEMK
jgi:hypothetical protein